MKNVKGLEVNKRKGKIKQEFTRGTYMRKRIEVCRMRKRTEEKYRGKADKENRLTKWWCVK